MIRALDARETRFVDEYLVDLDPRRAAIAAGYSRTVARSKAYQWVSNRKHKPHLFDAIAERKAMRAEATRITAERVVQELAKIAFASLGAFIRLDADGAPQITLENVAEDDLAVLSEIQTDTYQDGTGEAAREVKRVKIKLHDKLKALHALALHTDAFRKTSRGAATDLAAAIAEINARGSRAPLAHEREEGDRVR